MCRHGRLEVHDKWYMSVHVYTISVLVHYGSLTAYWRFKLAPDLMTLYSAVLVNTASAQKSVSMEWYYEYLYDFFEVQHLLARINFPPIETSQILNNTTALATWLDVSYMCIELCYSYQKGENQLTNALDQNVLVYILSLFCYDKILSSTSMHSSEPPHNKKCNTDIVPDLNFYFDCRHGS